MSSRLITVDELLEFSSGVDWQTVAEDAGAADPRQFIEQTNMVDRACGWAANFCEQPQIGNASGGLHATSQTESGRTNHSTFPGSKVWIDRDGFLNFKTDTLPVISVSASSWSYLTAPLVFSPTTAANWYIDGIYPQRYHLLEPSQDWTWLRQNPCVVQLTYVSGWTNALLSTAASAGNGVNLAVDSSLGAAIGDSLTVFDGGSTEQVVVSAVPDLTHITVASLAHPHDPGTAVTEVPFDIRHAILLACTWAAKHPRGTEALEMHGSGGSAAGGRPAEDEMTMAELLLEPYVRRI